MGEVVGLDSSIFIYLLEKHERFGPVAKKVLKEVESGKKEGILSAIGVIELLTGPKKSKDEKTVVEYRMLLESFANLTIGGLHKYGIEMAAEFRAVYGLRTPDAVHLATALDYGATAFYTNDKKLKKVKGIEIRLLSEIA